MRPRVMLNAIREFFESHVAAPAERGDERHTIELATAALLVEVVRFDRAVDAVQPAVIAAAESALLADPVLERRAAVAAVQLEEADVARFRPEEH